MCFVDYAYHKESPGWANNNISRSSSHQRQGNINIDYVERHANFPSIIQMSEHLTSVRVSFLTDNFLFFP